MDSDQLTNIQKDALREVSNIGAGHAATALSQMIGRSLSLTVPRVEILPFQKVVELVGGAEELVAGLFLHVFGSIRGNILLIFPERSILSLVSLLGQREYSSLDELEEMERSLLKEVGNILSASYLNAISQLLEMTFIPSVPGLAVDMAGAVLDYVLIELSQLGDTALVIETKFQREAEIHGHFFLLPDPNSFDALLQAIQEA